MTTETELNDKDGIITVNLSYRKVNLKTGGNIVVEIKEYCVFGFTILVREKLSRIYKME